MENGKFNMKSLIIIILFISCISGYTYANDNKQWVAKLLNINGSFNVMSKKERLEIADGLLKEINALKAYLPSLTLDQKKWLEAENKSLNSIKGSNAFKSKFFRLTKSSEYQLASINKGLEQISSGLNCILNKRNSLNKELLCWVYVNWALTDRETYNDAIHLLHYKKIVDFSPKIRKQFGLTFSTEDPWGGYNFFGRAIQKNIVLPLIEKFGK